MNNGDLYDLDLKPQLNYNITSYFGCYRNWDGSNSNQYYYYNNQIRRDYGCRGTW